MSKQTEQESITLNHIKRLHECENNLSALRSAIHTHRHNVWGDGQVGHDEDEQLYKILEVKP